MLCCAIAILQYFESLVNKNGLDKDNTWFGDDNQVKLPRYRPENTAAGFSILHARLFSIFDTDKNPCAYVLHRFEFDVIVKGSQLDAFIPLAIVYFYLEFKLSYLKNLKLFSIRVTEFSEPIVL